MSRLTLDDVAAIVAELPEVTEVDRRGTRAWSVDGKVFAWERPYSKADLRRFGEQAPPGQPVLAVRVEDLGEKEAVLGAGHRGFFTIEHFDGFAAVLVELGRVARGPLRDALVDGWLAMAPARLSAGYQASPTRRT